MVERKSVAIIYENNENWIGGTYYIQNLVASFLKLKEEEKPSVLLFSKTKQEFEQVAKMGYPYLEWHPLEYRMPGLPIFKRVVNKIVRMVNGGYDRFAFPLELPLQDVQAVFPAPVGLVSPATAKKIYWIPDCQEKHYPEFFSPDEIKNRMQSHRLIADSNDTVVFSSKNALGDFKDLFPGHKCTTAVLEFAVTHPALEAANGNSTISKYGISKRFFIAPNQFWKHKNHEVLIEAMDILKQRSQLNFELVFTGKEHDYRNPHHAESLKQIVKEKGLNSDIKFLGFIDRNDQLQLIKSAIAVVQPSLFEGWSTVIEDGKALNKFVIASDIPVHREQLPQNSVFFKAKDAVQLANILEKNSSPAPEKTNYEQNILFFAKEFISIACN